MNRKSVVNISVAALVLASLVAAVTIDAEHASASTSGTAANQVMIDNFSFAPATTTIRTGTTVTWMNHDDIPHTVVSSDNKFKSKALDTNDQFAFTFSEPGTYEYFCSLHPKMTGKVVVQ